MTRVLAKFLFEVKPTDPVTFVAVVSLLTSCASSASARFPLVALKWD
jgi:hypothetical protein